MLAVRSRATDGRGTCTLPDSQPCRLLPAHSQNDQFSGLRIRFRATPFTSCLSLIFPSSSRLPVITRLSGWLGPTQESFPLARLSHSWQHCQVTQVAHGTFPLTPYSDHMTIVIYFRHCHGVNFIPRRRPSGGWWASSTLPWKRSNNASENSKPRIGAPTLSAFGMIDPINRQPGDPLAGHELK